MNINLYGEIFGGLRPGFRGISSDMVLLGRWWLHIVWLGITGYRWLVYVASFECGL